MFIVWLVVRLLNGKQAEIGIWITPTVKKLSFKNYLSGFRKKCMDYTQLLYEIIREQLQLLQFILSM